MNIHELIKLIDKAAEGIDDFEKGAVGSNGYGFVFRNYDSNLSYVTLIGSSKICGAGSMRNFINNFKKNSIETIEEIYELIKKKKQS